jgi:hypothetical protein
MSNPEPYKEPEPLKRDRQWLMRIVRLLQRHHGYEVVIERRGTPHKDKWTYSHSRIWELSLGQWEGWCVDLINKKFDLHKPTTRLVHLCVMPNWVYFWFDDGEVHMNILDALMGATP